MSCATPAKRVILPPVAAMIVLCLCCLPTAARYPRASAVAPGCCTIIFAGLVAHESPPSSELTPRHQLLTGGVLALGRRMQPSTSWCSPVDATVLLLLACHGMARAWPAQLGVDDGGGRAAATTLESTTLYAAVGSSWHAPWST